MNVLDHPNCLELPERLSDMVGAAWVEHIPFAFWLMQALRPATVVELGVWAGDSYLAWCQAARSLNLAISIRGVDHWEGDIQTGSYGEGIYQTLKAYHDPRYADFSALIRGSFASALPAFADGSIDLLHVDGLHTYEAVKQDFDTWLPKVSPRGVVLFHDTVVLDQEFGVWKLWAELGARYPHFSFTHGFGLGVLLVGAQVPQPVRSLALLPAAEAEDVRAIFATLGKHIRALETLRVANKELTAAAGALEKALDAHAQGDAAEAGRIREAAGQRLAEETRRQAAARQREMSQAYETRLEHAQADIARRIEHQACLERQLATLQAHVEQLLKSPSYRAGRALTAPARLARDLLKG